MSRSEGGKRREGEGEKKGVFPPFLTSVLLPLIFRRTGERDGEKKEEKEKGTRKEEDLPPLSPPSKLLVPFVFSENSWKRKVK